MAAARRLAAIDVGSNSIRLVVAEVQDDGAYRVLDEERAMTRLGQGLLETGRLASETMGRTLEVIGKMKKIAAGFHVVDLRAVATSAVREAENGEAFRREAWRQHRVRIEVISSEEEARLAFLSAIRRFNLEGQSIAVADIGGGSLEVVLAAGSVVDRVHPLALGAVRLTERFVRSDPLKPKHWKALKRAIDEALRAEIGKPPFTVDVIVGSGGTFSALGGMIRYEREGSEGNPHGYTMSRAEVTRLLARLRELPLDARKQLPGLPPARADIIVAGAAAVARLTRHLGARHIIVNEGGVRDGLILSMLAELPGTPAVPAPATGRLDAVLAFARKCRSNERHGEHVARLAGELFDALGRRYKMPAEARELLVASAMLHDIGFLINHQGHHKHAYHLIMHSDLAGFSAREIELIANVVRYHRRALPTKKHDNYRRLPKDDRRLVRKLAGILRVAVALNRSHTQVITGLRAVVRRDRLRVTAVADREPAVELWDVRRKAALLEQVFRTRLSVRWRPAAEIAGGGPLRLVRGGRGAGGGR